MIVRIQSDGAVWRHLNGWVGRFLVVQGGTRNTSEGTDLTDSAGVIPRAIHQIFSILDAYEAEYTVKCSFLELYNEETTDLLAVGDAMDQKLKMLEDSGRVVVQVRTPALAKGLCSCVCALLVHRLCVRLKTTI